MQGFTLNLEKSHLHPTTRILHLSAVIDSAQGKVFLSEERRLSIRSLVDQVLSLQSVSLILLSTLLGKMILCIAIIPWARFHSWPLQWYLLPYQRARHSNSRSQVQLTSEVRLSLRWWSLKAMHNGSLFQEPQRLTLTTDASLLGWDAHLQSHVAHDQWSPAELINNINWLEL